MAAIGFLIMKKTMWGLADEVLDARIPLSNIINVGYQPMESPARVTLTLRNRCQFGNQISFYALQKFNPFEQNSVITELIQRIDQARSAAR